MLSALLAVLALAGAPQGTRVVCTPHIDGAPATALGGTFSTAPTGRPLNYIELTPTACGALLYASASTEERAAIRRLNPGVDFTRLLGVGLQVALHEAEHVGLQSSDECQVEKTARAKVGVLFQSLDPAGAASDERAAAASDAALPPPYHGC